MLKKFISMIMLISILTVSAHAGSDTGLKAAFDEFNYSLTVEWDQKDENFLAEQKDKFAAEIHQLKANGITNEDIIDFMLSEIEDGNAAHDLKAAFNVISINKMSSVEANQYMVETMKRSYNVGAHYESVAVYVGEGIVFTLFIVSMVLAVTQS